MVVLFWLSVGCPETPEDSAAEAHSAPNACGEWAAIEPERAWSYAYDSGSATSGDWTTTVRHFRDGSGTLETVSHTTTGNVSEDATTQTAFTCEAGLVISRVERQWAGLNAGTAYNGESATTYTETARIWPGTIAAGDSWTVHYVGSTLSDDVRTPMDYTETYDVNAAAQVSVNAGDFRAFRLVITSTAGDTETTRNEWVASGTGVVSGDDFSLTSVQ